MRTALTTAALIAALSTSSVMASGLTDPAIEADVVIAAAEHDSSKDDALIVTLWLVAVIAAAGGALQ